MVQIQEWFLDRFDFRCYYRDVGSRASHLFLGAGSLVLSGPVPALAGRDRAEGQDDTGDYWVKSHRSLRNHPKTRKLVRLLDVRLPEAVGVLHCLWWWSLNYADMATGDVSKYTSEEIADGCEWHGDPDVLLTALVKSGFLDEKPTRRIHDWDDYMGPLNVRRMANRAHAKASYERTKRIAQTEAELDAAVQADTEAAARAALEDMARYQAQSGTRHEESGAREGESVTPEESPIGFSIEGVGGDVSAAYAQSSAAPATDVPLVDFSDLLTTVETAVEEADEQVDTSAEDTTTEWDYLLD